MSNNIGKVACYFLIVSMFLLPVSFGPTAFAYPQFLALLAALVVIVSQNYSIDAKSLVTIRLVWLLPLLLYSTIHANILDASLVTSSTFFLMLIVGLLIGAGQTINYPILLAVGILAAAACNLLIGVIQFTNNHTYFYPVISHPIFKDIHYVYGNIRQANLFSTLMCLGIGSVWYLVSREKLSNRLAVVLIVGLVFGVVLSASRTGGLILVTFSTLHFCWRRGMVAKTSNLLSGAYLSLPLIYVTTWFLTSNIAPVFGLYLRAGLEKGGNAENPSRLNLYQNVVELIQQSPWFGHGIGEMSHSHFIHDFGNRRHNEIIDNAHNIVLHASVELGIIGALLLLLPFLAGAFKQKPLKEALVEKQMAWMFITALAIHSLLEYPLHYGSFWMIFCMSCCIVFPGFQLNLSVAKVRAILMSSSAVLFILLGYVIWDYDRVSQPFAGPHQRYAPNDPTPYMLAQKSILFKEYARFSLLAVVDLTPENAEQLIPELKRALHYTTEARITLRLIEALILTGRREQALYYADRFRISYPQDYKQYLSATEAKFKDVLVGQK